MLTHNIGVGSSKQPAKHTYSLKQALIFHDASAKVRWSSSAQSDLSSASPTEKSRGGPRWFGEMPSEAESRTLGESKASPRMHQLPATRTGVSLLREPLFGLVLKENRKDTHNVLSRKKHTPIHVRIFARRANRSQRMHVFLRSRSPAFNHSVLWVRRFAQACAFGTFGKCASKGKCKDSDCWAALCLKVALGWRIALELRAHFLLEHFTKQLGHFKKTTLELDLSRN